MFVLVMTASNMDEFPTIIFEPGYDFAAIHIFIIHTIHTGSIFYFAQGAGQRFALPASGQGTGILQQLCQQTRVEKRGGSNLARSVCWAYI